ncbi:MAG: hypothetical protein ACOC56_02375 [Atribacterota bacterium]
MVEISKEELKELRDDVLETKPTEQKANKKLIFDGRQYSLRFPKKFIDEAEIDTNEDEFEIKLQLPDPSKIDDEKPQLTATLIRK